MEIDPGMMMEISSEEKRFVCEIEVAFPTNLQAEQAMRVLHVDAEPTNRVTKAFKLSRKKEGKETEHDDVYDDMRGDGGDDGNVVVVMVIRFESKELKMLRVAVSSFYDCLNVVVKTMQEFDPTMRTEEA